MPKKNKVDVNSLSVEDRKKVRNAATEISNSMTRIEAEKDLQKEIISKLNEDTGLDKKTISKIARTYHKSNFNDEVEDHREFEEIYTVVINNG